MVDETAFRKELHATDRYACPFGKAILARCCTCTLAGKRAIAERETVICTKEPAHEQCERLYGLLYENSQFALKRIHPDAPLTHAQNMKIQCGGLVGLQLLLDKSEMVSDVAGLVDAVQHVYGELEKLPFSVIIQSVSAFQPRKPHND
jgi:hypothetical protein